MPAGPSAAACATALRSAVSRIATSVTAPSPSPLATSGRSARVGAPGRRDRAAFGGLLGIVGLIIAVVFLFWLVRPGQPETNEYGPPPVR